VAIRDGDGGRIVEVAFHGEYREIFPDERIISTEVYEGMPGGEALNTVMFTEAEGRGRARKGAEGRTTLTVLVQHTSKEARDAHTSTPGWRPACGRG
jgi:uncharacterized protein YndB with AHSA1/START domain